MPEPYSHLNPDVRLRPADGVTPSIADPNFATGDPATLAAAAVPTLPSQRYQLQDEIARGGMGVIWRATDTALGREVAVKVLQDKYALDSGAARRFADEARITAQLQHPAIPSVHDIGALSDGRPFLAMKFIKGQTLDKLLRARAEVASERGRFVAAFEQVCQALAYAHAHGVLHRDLKPSNVMVGAFGEVQVMDWGLAKVLGAHRDDRDDPLGTAAATQVVSLRDSDQLFTQAGSVLGTPSYMPPEQAIGAVDQIDARSDVFGLGGILATVLTGWPPFLGDTAEGTRQLAAKGKVQDCFARLDACGADPELIALCKRCLAPEKEDRPSDGGSVAQAIAELRAAADERARRAELDKVRVEGEKAAAEARALERRKRRRLRLGAAAALVLAVVGGLTAVLVVQHRANVELAQEQAKVQARFELAQKAIATFHTGVSEDVLLRNKQFTELRTRLLKEAAGFYGDLEKLLEGQTDARSRRLLAEGYFQLGELTEKIGNKTEALTVHRQALAIRRELAAAGADVEARLDVARSLRAVGTLLDATGDKAGALAAFEEQRDMAAALETESPTDAGLLLAQGDSGIGIVMSEMGKLAEALTAHEKARAVRQKLADAHSTVASYQSELADSHHYIGQALSETGKLAEALAAHEKARTIRQKLVDVNPTVFAFQSELASSHHGIADVLSEMGKPTEALAAHDKARAIRQELADANPAVTEFQGDLASSHHHIGLVLLETGKPAEALTAYEKARLIRQRLADANPAVTEFQSELADSHYDIGDLLRRTGKPAEALTAFEKARAIRQELADANPDVTEFQSSLAGSHHRIGLLLWETDKLAEALTAYEKALAVWQKLVETNPRVTSFQSDLADSYSERGKVLTEMGRFADALASLDKGQAILERLLKSKAKDNRNKSLLGENSLFRGLALWKTGRPAKAAAALRRTVALWDEIEDLDSDIRFERARALALLVRLSTEAKSGVTAAEAARFADQAIAGLREAVNAGWTQLDELKEPEFDSLRKRADFQKLVKELKTKAAAADRSNPDTRPQQEKK